MTLRKTLIAVAALLIVASSLVGRFDASDRVMLPTSRTNDEILAEYGEDKLEGELQLLCSQCHAFPEPDLLPAHRWVTEVDRALGFHHGSGNQELVEPPGPVIVAWYKKYARTSAASDMERDVDVTTVFGVPEPGPRLSSAAATSSVLVAGGAGNKRILFADMISGYLRETSGSDQSSYKLIHRARNPARIRECDLSSEFDVEYVVCDLGTPGVTDDLCGRVLWVRKVHASDDKFIVSTLCDQLGRVADARSADFDGDGDEDVVVAEFGWRETGSIVLLENNDGRFVRSTIDERHGAIGFEVADMNGDGKLDFVAVFGQELESVELFQNKGDLTFEPTRLFHSPNPTFGMSSVSVVDADGDQDLDILFSSGDIYDNFEIHDHNGVYLLTNNGDGRFEPKRIGNQAAVMASTVGDVDNDGDMDFVAGSFIPQSSRYSGSAAYPAIVLYEQTEPGVWQPRILKTGDCCHVTVELADIDNDGDLDLIAGSLHDDGGSAEPAWAVWKNRTVLQQITRIPGGQYRSNYSPAKPLLPTSGISLP